MNASPSLSGWANLTAHPTPHNVINTVCAHDARRSGGLMAPLDRPEPSETTAADRTISLCLTLVTRRTAPSFANSRRRVARLDCLIAGHWFVPDVNALIKPTPTRLLPT